MGVGGWGLGAGDGSDMRAGGRINQKFQNFTSNPLARLISFSKLTFDKFLRKDM